MTMLGLDCCAVAEPDARWAGPPDGKPIASKSDGKNQCLTLIAVLLREVLDNISNFLADSSGSGDLASNPPSQTCRSSSICQTAAQTFRERIVDDDCDASRQACTKPFYADALRAR